MKTYYETKLGKLYCGDCLDVMRNLPSNSIDSIITDPPYALEFMSKGWDKVLPSIEIWMEALRIAKPGVTLMAFGGTRTYHRLTCAIEDAGWQIRDCIMWIYGTGFPKSTNINKQIDKKMGAKIWDGWGTAIKPAYEPIVIAMKPIDGNYANNALKWGVAGLNIEGCRIPLNGEKNPSGSAKRIYVKNKYDKNAAYGENKTTPNSGRFPANVIFDEEAGKLLDEQSGFSKTGENKEEKGTGGMWQKGTNLPCGPQYGDLGGASRFFYCAKASKSERGEMNDHPTVKPLKLMEYLCKLTETPTKGIVLDMFGGSGTTAVACERTKRKYIIIEREKNYCEIIKERIINDDGIFHEILKKGGLHTKHKVFTKLTDIFKGGGD